MKNFVKQTIPILPLRFIDSVTHFVGGSALLKFAGLIPNSNCEIRGEMFAYTETQYYKKIEIRHAVGSSASASF